MFRRLAVAGLLVLQMIPAGALETARMALPGEFENQAESIVATGIGGRNRGEFRLGDYQGKFKRSESRLGIFDPLLAKNKGSTSFELRDVENTAGVVTVDCRFRRNVVTVGVVTFDSKKFVYDCQFRGGGLEASRLAIGQPKRDSVKEKFLARDLRRGDALIGNVSMTIESVHHYAGTPLSSQPPVGYLFRAGDVVIGAVELTDVNPTLYRLPGQVGEVNRAIAIGALALGLMWDPADSPLDD